MAWRIEDLPESVKLRTLTTKIQAPVILHLVDSGKISPVFKSQPVQEETTANQDLPVHEWNAEDSESLWEWANSRTQKLRDEGTRRAQLLIQVQTLLSASPKLAVRKALAAVAEHSGEPEPNLRRWWYQGANKRAVADYPQSDWAALLIPSHRGCTVQKDIDPRAWDWFTAYYLTRRQPTLAEAYRRTVEVARTHGWGELPSEATFKRRLEATIPMAQRVYLREGAEALGRIYPPQRRDKSVFEAGEAVSGDGLKFDELWICFPDGEVLNTVTGWFWQDMRSNKILAYRLAKTENTDVFRLATYDLVGLTVPRYATIDNTRVAANKAMTGRTAGRHRFKDRTNDPIGLLNQMGIDAHFTNPDKVLGSPGAKPIERAFGTGGIHEKVASHPKFLNRGYSSKTAIPFDEFAAVVAEEIQRYNTQTGRQTAMCRGLLSFEQAFADSFAQAEVRRVTEAQRNLLLLMPEVVRCDKRTGEIRLKSGSGPWGAHRYWDEALVNLKGEQVVAYYDPENLAKDVSVYRLDGRFFTVAAHLSDVAVNDTTTAREYGKEKARFVKAERKAAKAQQRMDELAVGQLYPSPEEVSIPEPGIVRPNFGQALQAEDGLVMSRRVVGGDFMPDGGQQADLVQAGERRVLSLLDAFQKSQIQI